MAFFSELTLNITAPPKLVTSSDQPTPLPSFPIWFVGEIRELKVSFVRARAAGAGKVEIVSAVGTSLRVVVGDPGNPITSATADPAVNDIYTLRLPLNISAVSSFLGSEISKNTKLEFQLVSATLDHDYQVDVTLALPVGTPSFVDPAPDDIALGATMANSLYVPQDGPLGGSKIWRSANGLYAVRQYLGDDGEMHFDPLTPTTPP